MHRVRSALLLLVLALVTSACAASLVAVEPDGASEPRPIPSPEQGCPPLRAGENIDPDRLEIPATSRATKPIRDAMASIRCLTQVEAPEEFIPRSEVLPIFDSLLEPEDKEINAKTDPFAKLLGWLPADMTLEEAQDTLLAQGVLGFYIPKENKLYVVNDGDALTPLAQKTVAHEWVHALQQGAFDIEALEEKIADFDFDASNALTSLIEGDAVHFEDVFVGDFFSRDKRSAANEEELRLGASSSADLVELFSLVQDLTAPYEYGPTFVEDMLARGTDPTLAELYKQPPTSTAEILHPDLYAEGFEPADVALPPADVALREAGGDWKQTIDGTWGEFSTANFIAGLEQSLASRELTVVEGWRGDRLGVYQAGDKVSSVIATKWASASKAEEVFDRIRRVLTRNGTEQGGLFRFPDDRLYQVYMNGDETLIVMSNDAAAAQALAGLAPGAGAGPTGAA